MGKQNPAKTEAGKAGKADRADKDQPEQFNLNSLNMSKKTAAPTAALGNTSDELGTKVPITAKYEFEQDAKFDLDGFETEPAFDDVIEAYEGLDNEFELEVEDLRRETPPRGTSAGLPLVTDDRVSEAVLNDIPLAALIHNFKAGSLRPEDRLKLEALVQPKMVKYIPHVPTIKQTAFLLLSNREAFYGGAAGGGKSDALLMAALQYVDVPGYSAILFRRTYSDLKLPGALMDRAREWLAPSIESGEVKWNDNEKTYRWLQSGATLTFGYLEHDNDKYRYQGAELQFIGFDELTQFQEKSYRYMFSRLRRLKGVSIPLRIRAASNPGGEGHEWVKQRYIVEGPEKKRVFIPAKMDDNPYLDMEEYEESLKELDPVTRAQLREGNWDVKTDDGIFDRSWFYVLDSLPGGRSYKFVRYWDLAGTEPNKRNKDPDWTVGLLLGLSKGDYFVIDIRRKRARPAEIEQLVQATAMQDGRSIQIIMEEEPGSSGKAVTDNYARHVLLGWNFKGKRSTGNKMERARPVSAAAEQRRIYVIRGAWNSAFFDELEAFPNSSHDDQVDAFSGAFEELSKNPSVIWLPTAVGGGGSYWGKV